MTQDKTVASHRISLAELVDSSENKHWAQAIDTNLSDGEKGGKIFKKWKFTLFRQNQSQVHCSSEAARRTPESIYR